MDHEHGEEKRGGDDMKRTQEQMQEAYDRLLDDCFAEGYIPDGLSADQHELAAAKYQRKADALKAGDTKDKLQAAADAHIKAAAAKRVADKASQIADCENESERATLRAQYKTLLKEAAEAGCTWSEVKETAPVTTNFITEKDVPLGYVMVKGDPATIARRTKIAESHWSAAKHGDRASKLESAMFAQLVTKNQLPY